MLISHDPDRRHGFGAKDFGTLLTVTDPDTGELWRFIPDTDSLGWLLLGACPDCEASVPKAIVATLADLGDYLYIEDYDLEMFPPNFDGDPAHHAHCPYADNRPTAIDTNRTLCLRRGGPTQREATRNAGLDPPPNHCTPGHITLPAHESGVSIMDTVVLGVGALAWSPDERRTDRYGAVRLDRDPEGATPDPATFDEAPVGVHGRLVAVVVATRPSLHLGDLGRGIPPGSAAVGEEITLGTGRLFVESSRYGNTDIGLRPDEPREAAWLDPAALYRCHDQTVRLELRPSGQG